MTYEQYWYGYPPWTVMEPSRVSTVVSFQSEATITPVHPIRKAPLLLRRDTDDAETPLTRRRQARPSNLKELTGWLHLGRNIDQYV